MRWHKTILRSFWCLLRPRMRCQCHSESSLDVVFVPPKRYTRVGVKGTAKNGCARSSSKQSCGLKTVPNRKGRWGKGCNVFWWWIFQFFPGWYEQFCLAPNYLDEAFVTLFEDIQKSSDSSCVIRIRGSSWSSLSWRMQTALMRPSDYQWMVLECGLTFENFKGLRTSIWGNQVLMNFSETFYVMGGQISMI